MRANGKIFKEDFGEGFVLRDGILAFERLFDVCAVYFFSRSSNSFVRLCKKDLK